MHHHTTLLYDGILIVQTLTSDDVYVKLEHLANKEIYEIDESFKSCFFFLLIANKTGLYRETCFESSLSLFDLSFLVCDLFSRPEP